MQGNNKDWLVRTKSGEILGPYSQAELYDELTRKRFTVEDEIAPSGGHWISAQALNFREGDDFTRTSTRSQALSHATSSITGSTQDYPTPDYPAKDDFTPTPEFIRPGASAQNGNDATPPAVRVARRPRLLRVAIAVIVVFLLWVLSTIVFSRKHEGPVPATPPAASSETIENTLLNEIYRKIHTGDSKGALKQLTSLNEATSPTKSVALMVPYAALLITERESIERARRILRTIANSSEDKTLRAEALMWLGYSHLVQDKQTDDRAASYFLESLQLDHKSPITRYNLGRDFMKKGKYLAALDYLQLAELAVPDLWLVHLHKANARALLGHKDEARKAYRTAIEKAPDRWYPYLVYAAFLNRIGDSQEAQRTLRTMFLKDPAFELNSPAPFGYYSEETNYAEYLNAYNVILKDVRGDDKDFGRIYLSYLNNFASDEGAEELKKLEQLAEKGHFPSRVLSLKISIDHFVDHNTVTTRLGRVPAELKNYGAYPHVVRGEAQLRLGDTEAAIAEFEKAIKIDPNSAAAHFSIAQALQKLHRRSEAEGHLKSLLSVYPDYIPALLSSQNF